VTGLPDGSSDDTAAALEGKQYHQVGKLQNGVEVDAFLLEGGDASFHVVPCIRKPIGPLSYGDP